MTVVGYKKGRRIELEVMSIGFGLFLEVEAAKAFLAMREAAKQEGVVLKPNTAFRTMQHQKLLYTKFQKGVGAKAAEPGYSNHQSGVAVDINRAPGDNPKTKKPDSPIDLWLEKNAGTFHFYRTVSGEPWHWEYLPHLAVKPTKAV